MLLSMPAKEFSKSLNIILLKHQVMKFGGLHFLDHRVVYNSDFHAVIFSHFVFI